MAMKLDRYYDVQCFQCGRTRSADFDKRGLWDGSPDSLRRIAKKEGWKADEAGNPICPACAAHSQHHK